MSHGYLLAFGRYLTINVLTCTLGGMHSLSFPISFSLLLWPGVLFQHSASTASDSLLGNVGTRLHRVLSWSVAIPSYDIVGVIAFPYMTQYAILGLFSPPLSDGPIFRLRVRCERFF